METVNRKSIDMMPFSFRLNFLIKTETKTEKCKRLFKDEVPEDVCQKVFKSPPSRRFPIPHV